MNPFTRYGGAIQPINYAIFAYAASDGTATFTFNAVAPSNVWTLTLNCPTAPDTARFNALTGATSFGQFKGSNSWGAVQLQGGDQLQVTATGLVPGTQYGMTGQGSCLTVAEPGIVYPSPYADSVTTSTEQVFIQTGVIPYPSGLTLSIPVNSSYRSLYIVLQGTLAHPASQVSVNTVGNVSLFNYNVINVPYGSLSYESVLRIPLVSLNDTAINLYFTNTSGGNITYFVGGDLADVDAAVYPEGTFNVQVSDQNIDTVTYGGASYARVTTSSTTSTQILPAPPSGFTTRIHSVTMYYSGTASTTPVIGSFDNSTGRLITLTYPYQNSFYAGGILTTSAVNVTSSTTTNVVWSVTYDYVTTPGIS